MIRSDGSDRLFFHDPVSFEVARRLRVTLDGQSQDKLNELEYIDGLIYANVWETNIILAIDPSSGAVLRRITIRLEEIFANDEYKVFGPEDTLNGIAWDAEGKRVFITGKKWPRLFEIKWINP